MYYLIMQAVFFEKYESPYFFGTFAPSSPARAVHAQHSTSAWLTVSMFEQRPAASHQQRARAEVFIRSWVSSTRAEITPTKVESTLISGLARTEWSRPALHAEMRFWHESYCHQDHPRRAVLADMRFWHDCLSAQAGLKPRQLRQLEGVCHVDTASTCALHQSDACARSNARRVRTECFFLAATNQSFDPVRRAWAARRRRCTNVRARLYSGKTSDNGR